MRSLRQLIPRTVLPVVIIVAAAVVIQLDGQVTTTSDFTNPATAEVRDASGQVVLRGQFEAQQEDDDDIERKARLTATGIDADAAGEAEVEFAKAEPAIQEIEFSARNLTANAAFTFVIDGRDIGTATSDRRGRVELELNVGTSGAATPR
jgi:hypothetical protein